MLLDVHCQYINGYFIASAFGYDKIGIALARFDKLQVHGLENACVTFHYSFCRTSPFDNVSLNNTYQAFIRIGIYKYFEIKKGHLPETPVTVIFGAKAAPAYTIAKDIIHLILCLQELIDNDPEVAPYLKVVMVENYNVTLAEKLIPSCDISEQISLASKEASGTGNMKFMLNGAVTMGTEDGANVEIHQFVGDENIYIFGESSEQVIEHYRKMDYNAVDYYINDEEIRRLVDFIISPELLRIGDKYLLLELHAELIRKDWFMTLLDFEDYAKVKDQALSDYEDRTAWAEKMLVNIGKAGYFSSDRTIQEYVDDIWHLDKVTVGTK